MFFQRPSGEWFKSLCVRHLFLLITGAAILVTRWRVMGSAPPVFQVFDNPHSFVNSTLLRVSGYLSLTYFVKPTDIHRCISTCHYDCLDYHQSLGELLGPDFLEFYCALSVCLSLRLSPY